MQYFNRNVIVRKFFEYHYFLLLLAVYFTALQFRPVFSPAEVLCAEFVREMVLSGDFFSLQLNSEVYKPGILPGVQISALLAEVFSLWQFFLRLLSFGAVCFCAWLIYYFFRIKKYSRLTAQTAVCIFFTMPAVFFAGTSVLPDMFFALLTVLSSGVLFSCQDRDRGFYPAVLVYLCSGLLAGTACCLKDFSGLLLPLVSYLIYLVTAKRWKDLLLFPVIMFIECLLILLLWNWFNPKVEYIHFLSELTAMHTRIEFRLCSFRDLMQLIAGGIFWIPFFAAACIGFGKKLWQNEMLRMTVLFLATALCHFLFFDSSLSSILFVILPVTILTAAGLRVSLFRKSWGKRFLHGVSGSLLFLDLAALLMFFSGFFAGLPPLDIFYKDEAALWLFTIVFFSFSAVCVVFLLYEKQIWQKFRCFLFSLFPFILILTCIYPRSVIGKTAPAMLLRDLPPIQDSTMVVTVTRYLPDVCWGLKRRDVVLLDSGDPVEEWKQRSANKKFGSVLLILSKQDYDQGTQKGIFPDNAVWSRNWDRDVPCVIVKYRYNMKDLKK